MSAVLENGPENALATVLFAHGAGAGITSPFMEAVAAGMAGPELRVVRFEFPYMTTVRETGRKRPPDRAPVLLDFYRELADRRRGSGKLILAGKSMGGRMASLIADEIGADGLVVFGYPFHPVGKPDKLRTEHLETLKTPTLIIQGERDPFGTRAEVAAFALSAAITMSWVPKANHSLVPLKSTGISLEQSWASVSVEAARFVEGLPG